jgi:hypothetical protein
MTRFLGINKLKRMCMWWHVTWSDWRNSRKLQHNLSSGRDSNPGPPQHEAGVLANALWRAVPSWLTNKPPSNRIWLPQLWLQKSPSDSATSNGSSSALFGSQRSTRQAVSMPQCVTKSPPKIWAGPQTQTQLTCCLWIWFINSCAESSLPSAPVQSGRGGTYFKDEFDRNTQQACSVLTAFLGMYFWK